MFNTSEVLHEIRTEIKKQLAEVGKDNGFIMHVLPDKNNAHILKINEIAIIRCEQTKMQLNWCRLPFSMGETISITPETKDKGIDFIAKKFVQNWESISEIQKIPAHLQ